MARRKDEDINQEQFVQHCCVLVARLKERSELRWGVFLEDTYTFGVTLLALLAAGKTPVILPSGQELFVRGLRGQLDGLICEKAPSCAALPHLDAAADLNERTRGGEAAEFDFRRAQIVLFTSGSTGQPKAVVKSLRQLEEEVEVHEALWGGRVRDAMFLSTVTHQHIYGLLFRLLWPLAYGRCFDTTTYNDPWSVVQRGRELSRFVLISSPALLARLPQAKDLVTLSKKAVMVFSSGGILRRDVANSLRDHLSCGVSEVFGSTETGGIAYRSRLDVKEEVPWTPLPQVRIKCRPGGDILVIKSPFEGSGRWFSTSDTVQMMPGNSFLLKGRSDNIVKVGEKRLSLTDLEQRLLENDLTLEAAAAVQEANRATVVMVVVPSDEGKELLRQHGKRTVEKRLQRWLVKYFEAALVPKKWRFVAKLPANAQGKVTRAAILQLFEPTC